MKWELPHLRIGFLHWNSTLVFLMLLALARLLASCATGPAPVADPKRITIGCAFANCELERIGPERYRLRLGEMSTMDARAAEQLSILSTASAARVLSREYFVVADEYWTTGAGTRVEQRGALPAGLARVVEFAVYAEPPPVGQRVRSVKQILGEPTPRHEVDSSPDALRMHRAKTAALVLLFLLSAGGVSMR